MIKINLLPYRSERKKELILQQTVLGAAPIAVVLIAFIALWFFNNSQINTVKTDIVQIKKQIDECTLQMKEIDDYKKRKEILQKKMDVIVSLQKGKNGPVHLLDEMATSIPGNIWLTSVKQKAMVLEIEGSAIDNLAVSNYMVNLEKSAYVSNVDLKSIVAETKRAKKTLILKKFIITCNLSYSPEKSG